MDIVKLSAIAKDKKERFLDARNANAAFDVLKILAAEYVIAIAEWHKARYPGKRFHKPSVGYLIRAL